MPAPSDIWQIKSAQDTSLHSTSFAALGAEDVRIEWRKQEVSRASFTLPSAIDSAPALAFDKVYSITKNGGLWFSGRCVTQQPDGSGAREEISYELACPWNDFEQIMFQQLWPTTDVATGAQKLAAIPRYNFGQFPNGARMTMGEALNEILQWALASGAFFQMGTIEAGGTFPVIAKVNMTVGRALQEILRWMPDCAAWFDHSVFPPKFNVTRRGDCPVATLALDRKTLMSLGIKPCPELVPPCVALTYERTDVSNNNQVRVTQTDIYPEGFTGAERRAVTATMELAGWRLNGQKQSIKTMPNVTVDSSGLDWLNFFAFFNPDISQFTPTNLSFETDSFYAQIDPGQKDQNPKSPNYDNDIAYDITAVRNTLIKGSIPDWLLERSATNKACKATFGVLVSFKFDSMAGTTSDAEFQLAKKTFGQPGGNSVWLTAHPTVTNIAAGSYYNTTDVEAAEQPPNNLAQWLYESLSMLHYKTAAPIVLNEQECSGKVRLNNILNLDGGAEQWAVMKAVVYGVSERLATGETSIDVGPPAHLEPGDFLELLRAAREAVTSTRLSERVTGKTDDATVSSNDPVGFIADSSGNLAGDGGPSDSFPITEATSGSDIKIQVGNGKLIKSLKQNDTLAITGLNSPISVDIGHKVWIDIAMTDNGDGTTTPSSASLEHGSSFWTGYPDPIEMDTSDSDNPIQTDYDIIIAEIVAISDTRDGLVIGTKAKPMKVVPLVKSDLLLSLSTPFSGNGSGSSCWTARPASNAATS